MWRFIYIFCILPGKERLSYKNERESEQVIFNVGCDLRVELKQGVFKHVSFHKTFKRHVEMEDTCSTILR
jgi:hypothetical protein